MFGRSERGSRSGPGRIFGRSRRQAAGAIGKLSGIRPQGWSVVQTGRKWTASGSNGDRYLRGFWDSRRGGFYRLALFALAGWGIYNLIGSGHGLLRLRALAHQEAELRQRYSTLVEQTRQAEDELREDPALGLERGLREKYMKSRKNEIVYYVRRVPGSADSSAQGAAADTGSGR